ncbi:MAG: hypothetical protein O7F12_08965 [Nitrospirae bacterium]|nr:hypothetical protein [Nitrospirota bacterium]
MEDGEEILIDYHAVQDALIAISEYFGRDTGFGISAIALFHDFSTLDRSGPSYHLRGALLRAGKHAEEFVKGLQSLPQEYQKPSFQCLSDYEKCMTSGTSKIACASLLAIDIANQIIPFAYALTVLGQRAPTLELREASQGFLRVLTRSQKEQQPTQLQQEHQSAIPKDAALIPSPFQDAAANTFAKACKSLPSEFKQQISQAYSDYKESVIQGNDHVECTSLLAYSIFQPLSSFKDGRDGEK